MMPATDGLSTTLHRQLHARRTGRRRRAAAGARGARRCSSTARAHDSAGRGRARCATRGVRAIVVLGGDGTHRVVAKACGDVPLCALSTGTNNAFPEMRETTVAGIATGLVATGRAARRAAPRGRARGRRDGGADLALVDVAVSRERFVGARAIWRAAGRQRALRHLRQPERRRAVGDRRGAGAARRAAAGAALHVRLAADPAGDAVARPARARPRRAGRGRRAPRARARARRSSSPPGGGHDRARRRARDRAPPGEPVTVRLVARAR